MSIAALTPASKSTCASAPRSGAYKCGSQRSPRACSQRGAAPPRPASAIFSWRHQRVSPSPWLALARMCSLQLRQLVLDKCDWVCFIAFLLLPKSESNYDSLTTSAMCGTLAMWQCDRLHNQDMPDATGLFIIFTKQNNALSYVSSIETFHRLLHARPQSEISMRTLAQHHMPQLGFRYGIQHSLNIRC